MKKKSKRTRKKIPKCKIPQNGSCSGAAYFIGLIGAAVYYISTATGFWNGVLGLLKAIVWPAFLVYHVLKFLGA
ncbi:hypothetical protein KY349_05155 [Candidatus Woesearchaeota archaeon]|nr:hypothetical protein [Candidatus Woesearchaeota archaeon]